MPVSALVLANGHHARVLGIQQSMGIILISGSTFSLWRRRTASSAYANRGGTLAAAAERIAEATPLVGLNSVDFLVDGNEFWILEINPRPGATLDIFEPPEGSLFALHMAACEGELPQTTPRLRRRGGRGNRLRRTRHAIDTAPRLAGLDYRQAAWRDCRAGGRPFVHGAGDRRDGDQRQDGLSRRELAGSSRLGAREGRMTSVGSISVNARAAVLVERLIADAAVAQNRCDAR